MILQKTTQRTEFHDVWNKFVADGDTKDVPLDIRQSWERCKKANIDPRKDPTLIGIDQRSLRKRIDEHFDLHQILQSHNKSIEKHFDYLPLAMFFCDRDGYVLCAAGDDKILRLMEEGLQTEIVGGSIKEQVIGTTAPGICLEEKRFAAVHAEEHYIQTNHWASCIATPIFDCEQNLLGCLDFTVTVPEAGKLGHLIPLLLNTANSIQFELSLKKKLEQLEFFHSYYRSTFDYSGNILVLVSGRGEVIDLNRTAQEVFRIRPEEIRNRDVRNILGAGSKIESLFRGRGGKTSFGDRNSEWFSAESIPLSDRSGREVAFLLRVEKERVHKGMTEGPSNISRYAFRDIIGAHPMITTVLEKAQRAAKTGSNVLIEGETGTGKELFAHAIHKESRYGKGPFVAVNCAAFPRELIESELFGYEKGAYTGALRDGNVGKFELANTGTIFLDEIHSMDLAIQTKILRVVEDRLVTRLGGKYAVPLDIRIIAASTAKLEEEIAKGHFLPALFFRLNVVRLSLPSLRERKEDIPLLVEFFVDQMNRKFRRSIRGVEPKALMAMFQYSWPGNVRELRNCIESAFNFCTEDTIRSGDLLAIITDESKQQSATGQTMDDITKNLLVESLNRFGNVKEAARSLGIPVSNFYRKMRKFGIPRISR